MIGHAKMTMNLFYNDHCDLQVSSSRDNDLVYFPLGTQTVDNGTMTRVPLMGRHDDRVCLYRILGIGGEALYSVKG